MALFIGIVIILIVLFMIFAMALAEWMDKDPGEFFRKWFKPRTLPATSGSEGQGGDKKIPVSASAKPLAPSAKEERPKPKPVAVKKTSKKAVTKSASRTKGVAKTKRKKRTTT